MLQSVNIIACLVATIVVCMITSILFWGLILGVFGYPSLRKQLCAISQFCKRFSLYPIWYKISQRNFWFMLIATVITGQCLRYSLEFSLGINVVSTPFCSTSIVYYLIMAIMVPIYNIIVDKWLLKDTNDLINYIYISIICKAFWFGIFSAFLISFAIRANINYWDVPALVYSFYCSYLFLYLADVIPSYGVCSMMPYTNFRAGQHNGPIQFWNPYNWPLIYYPNCYNQPMLYYLGLSLEHQRMIGLTQFSKFTFTREQEDYILTFLWYNHRNLYDNLMLGPNGYLDKPQWRKQANTKWFNNLLINGR